jgi:hypothetical protein
MYILAESFSEEIQRSATLEESAHADVSSTARQAGDWMDGGVVWAKRGFVLSCSNGE